MSFRIVVVKNRAKLSYKDEYLLVKDEGLNIIHLSEINTIIVESTQVTISSYLINKLIDKKIKVMFCDEKHNPLCELTPYYGSHNASKKALNQSNWCSGNKKTLWTYVVAQKMKNQSKMLFKYGFNEYKLINNYIQELELADVSNREGHSAKVYFNALFGKSFKRDIKTDVNSALNYGYSILLSAFNRSIVSLGNLTQLGINHKNEFNHFNLSSDLMEPFRVLVDELVYVDIVSKNKTFNSNLKLKLIDILNKQIIYDNKKYFLNNAIQVYVKKAIDELSTNNLKEISKIDFFEFIWVIDIWE